MSSSILTALLSDPIPCVLVSIRELRMEEVTVYPHIEPNGCVRTTDGRYVSPRFLAPASAKPRIAELLGRVSLVREKAFREEKSLLGQVFTITASLEEQLKEKTL